MILIATLMFALRAYVIKGETTTYSCTNGPQSFVIPSHVNSIIVQGYGGAGGNSLANGIGGKAGYISATCFISPGTLVQVNVGCFGQSATSSNHYAGVGGYNGGGASAAGAGGGGGATDIRIDGTEVFNRIVVAAGGGGAGDYATGSGNNGGAGGGQVGLPGYEPNLGYAGSGGEQANGGSGGCYYNCGSTGGFGNGGTGAQSEQTVGGGGGGGSGYYGGGGGGNGYGGGGGSSYASTTYCTSIVYTTSVPGPSSGDGSLTITYVSAPSSAPSSPPSSAPTSSPSTVPSSAPSSTPSSLPTAQPSTRPSASPSAQPITAPTAAPTSQPTSLPSSQPTSKPTSQPSAQPTAQPFSSPTITPTARPSVAPISAADSNIAAVPVVFMVLANFFARLLRRGHEDSLNEVSPIVVQILHITINGASWFLFLQTFFFYYNQAVNQQNYSTQWLTNLLIASKLPLLLAWVGFLMLLFAPNTAAWIFSCSRSSSSSATDSNTNNNNNDNDNNSDASKNLKKKDAPLRMYLNARIISPTYTIVGVSATTFCGLVILGSVFDLYALRYLPWNRTLETKILRAFPTKTMVRLCLYSTALAATLQAFASLAIFVEQGQNSLTGAFFIGLSLFSAIIVALDVLMLMVMSSVSLQQDVKMHKEKLPEILEELVTLMELHDDYEERERFFSLAVLESTMTTTKHSVSSTQSSALTVDTSSQSQIRSTHSDHSGSFSSIFSGSSSSSLFLHSNYNNNNLQSKFAWISFSSTPVPLILSTARKLKKRGLQSTGRQLQSHYQNLLFPADTTSTPGLPNSSKNMVDEDVLQLMSLATAQLEHNVTMQTNAIIALDYWFKHDEREVSALLAILAQEEEEMRLNRQPVSPTLAQQTNNLNTTSTAHTSSNNKHQNNTTKNNNDTTADIKKGVMIDSEANYQQLENHDKEDRLDVQFYRNILIEADVRNVPSYRPWSLLQIETAELLLSDGSTPIADNSYRDTNTNYNSNTIENSSPLHTTTIKNTSENRSKNDNHTSATFLDKEAELEDVLITVSFHPMFRAEVRLATLVWERQEHVFLRACFLQTVSFIPPFTAFLSPSSVSTAANNTTEWFQTLFSSPSTPHKRQQHLHKERHLQQCSELVIAMSQWRMFSYLWSKTSTINASASKTVATDTDFDTASNRNDNSSSSSSSGYSYSLAQRIAQRPALWLVRLSPRMIDTILTISDLTSSQGKFNALASSHQDLDLIELAAIYFALPDHFSPEYDLEGKKQRWKNRLLTHLRHRLRLQREDLLIHLRQEKKRHLQQQQKLRQDNNNKAKKQEPLLQRARKSLFVFASSSADNEEKEDKKDKASERTGEESDEVEDEVVAVPEKEHEEVEVEDSEEEEGASFDPHSLPSSSTDANSVDYRKTSDSGSLFSGIFLTSRTKSAASAPSKHRKSHHQKQRKSRKDQALLRHPVYKSWPGTHGPHALLPDWLLLSVEEVEAEFPPDEEDEEGNYAFAHHNSKKREYEKDGNSSDFQRQESRDQLLRDRMMSTSGWFTYQSTMMHTQTNNHNPNFRNTDTNVDDAVVSTLTNASNIRSSENRNSNIGVQEKHGRGGRNSFLSDLSVRFSDIYAMNRNSTQLIHGRASEIEMDTTNISANINSNTANNNNNNNNFNNINNNKVINPLAVIRRPSQLTAAAANTSPNNDASTNTS